MKRPALIIILLTLAACGGSMTDEQRKRMHEASDQQKIMKVTESEILEAAFSKGRSVMKGLQTDNPSIGSVEKNEAVKIHWLAPGEAHGLEIERQLIDAYLNSLMEGSTLQDNVQKIGADSMLYTNPVIVTREDKSIEIKGTWNIWMSKKQLILAMDKK
jgi:hypothetical protein